MGAVGAHHPDLYESEKGDDNYQPEYQQPTGVIENTGSTYQKGRKGDEQEMNPIFQGEVTVEMVTGRATVTGFSCAGRDWFFGI